MKRTVIIEFGSTEARRYEIEHTGHDGPGGCTHPHDDDYFIEAKDRLLREGFGAAQVEIACCRFAD